jgi:hypothetical protein
VTHIPAPYFSHRTEKKDLDFFKEAAKLAKKGKE